VRCLSRRCLAIHVTIHVLFLDFMFVLNGLYRNVKLRFHYMIFNIVNFCSFSVGLLRFICSFFKHKVILNYCRDFHGL
jgi:hypothetical protein